jgi:hemolysin activation/secretion protein
MAAGVSSIFGFGRGYRLFLFLFATAFFCVIKGTNAAAAGAEMTDSSGVAGVTVTTPAAPRFKVTGYMVEDNGLLPMNVWLPLLSKYTGPHVSLNEIVKAASALQGEYRDHGYPKASIAFAQEQIKDGVVTFNVFQTAIPQIVVSGVRYSSPSNLANGSMLPGISPVLVPQTTAPAAATATTTPPVAPAVPLKPATPAQIAAAQTALLKEIYKLNTEKPDTRIHVISTNAGPHFEVEHYVINGNTILTPYQIAEVLTNIDGAYGTNVSFDGVRTVVAQLQGAYQDRGYVTVAVGLPKQKLTNATVKVQVVEGRVAVINVTGNEYFSSNNVMRALPSLHTNIILNGDILQAELNRANANQDRQIYPILGPGPDPGTSALTLNVKDQLPLHAKMEFDNYNSPGTPALRVNSSAVYDNLWQLEHSLGVQYAFSPTEYKPGEQWNFYDLPLVANYSTFYTLPLGNPQSAQNLAADNSSFGYSEATRKFNMPPLPNTPSLTFFAGRATIDTGVTSAGGKNFPTVFTNEGNVYQENINESSAEDEITVNNDLGTRLSIPLHSSANFNSVASIGLDIKSYQIESAETNIFTVSGQEIDYEDGGIVIPINDTEDSPKPFNTQTINYLPLSLRYDANWIDAHGTTSFGIGAEVNLWFWAQNSKSQSITVTNGMGMTTNATETGYTRGVAALQQITGSDESHGHWVTITPSFSRSLVINNWTTLFRINGQWGSEPLIPNEQFGLGGVNSVRGYHEGELFGDSGWNASLEEDTPPHIVGMVANGMPLAIRGSLYMDGGVVYLLDAPGPSTGKLWSTGVGVQATVSSHWEAQFLFSLPLISTSLVPRYQPYFNFALTAQF